jgi:glycosyltransferase involved in cell wall biosynthesis
MVVIPNISYENLTPNRRKNKGTTILFTGRLIEYKGVDLLLMALSKVKSKIKKIMCYIVGTGPEMEKLKKMAHELDIEDNVCFTGFVEHKKLESYYLQSDLFIFPVRWVEPFGRSILEAMNYGLPSIVSDMIDPELRDDATVVFKNNDWNDLADKIIYLLSNPNEQELLSKKAKNHIKNYSPDKIIPKIEKIYLSLN